MKALRVLLTILVAGGLAYLLFRGIRGTPPAPPPTITFTPEDPNAPSPFDPFGAPKDPKPADPAPAASPEPAAPDIDETLVGTPTTAASEVSLVVPYKTGTKCRYRVTDALLQRNRDTEEMTWYRFIWTVSTEVVQGDGSGAARVRFAIESFRYQTEAPGRRIDIDSENPDRKLIDDKTYGLARVLKPWLAIRRMPVEFVIDAAGVVRAVDGVNAVTRKFLEAVSLTSGAQSEQDADDAPTTRNMIEQWGERLFPALGGGKVKGDATRGTALRNTAVDRWCVVTSGTLRATHDDADAFRVEFKGTPAIEEQQEPVLHPKFVNVEKAKVITSADAYVASWRFDRAHGRLLASRKRAKYCLVVGYRAGVVNGQQQFEHPYIDLDMATDVELLDK